jgi:glycosyltransferase involved in cell wall biosynthesis
MKKIVIITNMMSFYRLDLFCELAKNPDYKFHVIFSAEKEDNNRIWEINRDKINFDYTILKSKSIIKKSDGIKENRIINIPKDVFKTLRKINPDIVIASEYNMTCVKSFFYSKLFGKKYISWSDGTLNSERFISRSQLLLRKMICKNSNYFIASGTETKEAQVAYGAKKNKLVLSFLTVDVEDFIEKLDKIEKTENKVPHILFCGYLLKLKGVHFLFEALKNVESNFVLDIIGKGEEEEYLKKLAAEYKIDEKVRFLGYKNRSEIVAFYKNADIFVFPSLNDAFGLVLVEALASKLPIITSIYAGGSKDTVDEGKNGFIVDPENTKIFSEKLEILLSDKTLRQKMGEMSYEKAGKFYLKNVAKGFFEAIEKC